MWRLALVLAASCAQATTGGHTEIDAAGTTDGPRLIDARPIDAAGMACTSTATCAAAADLGAVSGDTGSQTQTASGYQAAWYRVRVTEDDSSVIGAKLKVTVQLTSPATANYDLYLYVNTGSDVVECTTVSASSMMTGTADSANLSWGEGTISNGADDSRSVSIEVRPVATSCSAAQPWHLTVLGHT